jgi:lipopolysaccharide transport system ATP-binding protein
MEDMGSTGRTVLFVSHNLQAVTRLCPRCLLLDEGRLVMDGASERVLHEYLLSGIGATAERRWDDAALAPGNEIVRLRAVRVRTEEGGVSAKLDIRRPIGLEMSFEVLTGGHILTPNFHLYDDAGACVFIAGDTSPEWRRAPRPAGRYRSTAWIPGNLLAEGSFVVHAAVSTMDPLRVHAHERDTVAFQVVDSLDGDSARGDYAGPLPGAVRPMLTWATAYEPASADARAERKEVRG